MSLFPPRSQAIHNQKLPARRDRIDGITILELLIAVPCLWLRGASKRMAPGRMTSSQENAEERYHQRYQQHSNKDQPAFGVAEIHGPPQAVAFGNKHRGIIRIVVKKAAIPVAIIIAIKVAAITISRCVSFTLGWQEQDKHGGNQEYPNQQD